MSVPLHSESKSSSHGIHETCKASSARLAGLLANSKHPFDPFAGRCPMFSRLHSEVDRMKHSHYHGSNTGDSGALAANRGAIGSRSGECAAGIHSVSKEISSVHPLAPIEKQLYRFILGIDTQPVPLNPAEVAEFQDPFAQMLFHRSMYPDTLQELISIVRNYPSTGNPNVQLRVCRIAENGQFPYNANTPNPASTLRLAIAASAPKTTTANYYISTGPTIDTDQGFLQVASWDKKNKWWNFFQRIPAERKEQGSIRDQDSLGWVWAGNSDHALAKPTRGRGPFHAHLSGCPIMKELRRPWTHWHSSFSTFNIYDLFEPSDKVKLDGLINLFTQDEWDNGTGDIFEQLVESSIFIRNQARVTRANFINGIKQTTLSNVSYFYRHVLQTDIVNLRSSLQESSPDLKQDIILPMSFFFNSETLTLPNLLPNINTGQPTVSASIYYSALSNAGLYLISNEAHEDDPSKETFQVQDKETQFAFLVPEFAGEDTNMISQMLGAKLITPRLAATLLMVDFTQPVFSFLRRALMEFVPNEVSRDASTTTFAQVIENLFVQSVQQKIAATKSVAAADNLSHAAAQEFLRLWDFGEKDWESKLTAMVQTYIGAVVTKLTQTSSSSSTSSGSKSGSVDYMVSLFQLAGYRRHVWRVTPSYEFDLTMASTKGVDAEIKPEKENERPQLPVKMKAWSIDSSAVVQITKDAEMPYLTDAVDDNI